VLTGAFRGILYGDSGQLWAQLIDAATVAIFGFCMAYVWFKFSNLITPLLVRGVPIAISDDRLPRAVLDDLARTGSTVFPGMPLFFQAFNEMTQVPPLPKLRLCISAGAPLTRSVARTFQEKFGRRMHSFYGASECGGICYDHAATCELEVSSGRRCAESSCSQRARRRPDTTAGA
jgi:acyl-coenzyme A synthetase/AMP-(fatty) acid ligase